MGRERATAFSVLTFVVALFGRGAQVATRPRVCGLTAQGAMHHAFSLLQTQKAPHDGEALGWGQIAFTILDVRSIAHVFGYPQPSRAASPQDPYQA